MLNQISFLLFLNYFQGEFRAALLTVVLTPNLGPYETLQACASISVSELCNFHLPYLVIFVNKLAFCTSSHLKRYLEPAVPPIGLFLMINTMPLKRCVVKGNYFTALLRNEARNKFLMSGPWLSVAILRLLSFAAARWRCLYLLL